MWVLTGTYLRPHTMVTDLQLAYQHFQPGEHLPQRTVCMQFHMELLISRPSLAWIKVYGINGSNSTDKRDILHGKHCAGQGAYCFLANAHGFCSHAHAGNPLAHCRMAIVKDCIKDSQSCQSQVPKEDNDKSQCQLSPATGIMLG